MQQHRHHMNGSILKMNHSRDRPAGARRPRASSACEIAREGLRRAAGAGRSRRQQGDAGPQGPGRRRGHRHPAPGQRSRPRTTASGPQAMQFERARRRPLPLRRFADRDRRDGQGRAAARSGAGRAIATRRCRCGIASPNTTASWRAAAPRAASRGILGDTVRYAFVCDPDGNHIEISQRASLTAEAVAVADDGIYLRALRAA